MKPKKHAQTPTAAASRFGGLALNTPGALIAAQVRAGGLRFHPGRLPGGIEPFRKLD